MRKRIIPLAIALTVILIMPLGIKTAHFLSHEYDQKHLVSGESTITTFSDHCSICDFEYTSFIRGHSITLNFTPVFFRELSCEFTDTSLPEFNGINEPLRGPPAFI